MGRTLVICKPDALRRGLVGEILGRFERRGLRLAAAELRQVDEETARKHYAEHAGKAFVEDLVRFITSGPCLIAIVEGPGETWRMVRTMMGATNPQDAQPGTIRGDFGTDVLENLIHGSDSAESAEREIGLFFPALAGPAANQVPA
jgi:nucleoside-diphosphate kinase